MYFRVKKMIVPRFILSETTLMGHVWNTLLSVIDKAMEAKPQMTESADYYKSRAQCLNQGCSQVFKVAG